MFVLHALYALLCSWASIKNLDAAGMSKMSAAGDMVFGIQQEAHIIDILSASMLRKGNMQMQNFKCTMNADK